MAEARARIGLGVALTVFAVVAGLEAATRSGAIDRYVLIPPSEMAWVLGGLLVSGEIDAAVWQTGRVMAVSVMLSVVLGFAAGIAVNALPRLRRALQPVFTSYYAVPIFVFYPVFIVLFGLNDVPLILVGSLFGIIAMLVATLNARDRVPSVLLRTGDAMRLSPGTRLVHIVLPAMAPHLVVGLKLAVAYSMIGVVAGEFILATEGVGYRIAYAYNNFQTPRMYALMLLVLLTAVALNFGLQRLEAFLVRRSAG